MIPVQFGTATRTLAGILHEPAAGIAPLAAVLLCNPFGQEAVRVHRLQRVLADQLARHGYMVLRFDYYGSGESMGDDEEFDLDGAVGDVISADEELRSFCPEAPVVWAGARLGASLAVLAAARSGSDRSPPSLVLWEPVLDGAEYLRELGRDHHRALLTGYGAFIRSVRQRIESQTIGYRIGSRLREELGRLRVPPLAAGTPARLIVAPGVSEDAGMRPVVAGSPATQASGSPSDASAGPPAMPVAYARWWQESRRPVADVTVFQHDFDWTAEEALNTALVPAAAVRLLRSRIEEAA